MASIEQDAAQHIRAAGYGVHEVIRVSSAGDSGEERAGNLALYVNDQGELKRAYLRVEQTTSNGIRKTAVKVEVRDGWDLD